MVITPAVIVLVIERYSHMELPLVIHSDLDKKLITNWQTRFTNPVRENVWRRHQDSSNAHLSGWEQGRHPSRRLLHYKDTYDIIDNSFVLKDVYLYWHIDSTQDELNEHSARLDHSIKAGGWSNGKLGNLTCEVERRDGLHVRIYSKPPTQDDIDKPWNIFKLGIRQTLPRGNPTYTVPQLLFSLLPAQVELGCGPSIEAGIPPLHSQHRVYSICRKDKSFIFTPQEDCIYEFLSHPKIKWYQASDIHHKCLTAEPTGFYHALKELHDAGLFVGPVLTNNFDNLPLSVGLPTLSLRQYDATGVYPPVDFDSRARSLFVIGSHADRRMAQHHARQRGLHIVFIDPEGYDNKRDYPLESPQDSDYVVRMSAGDAMRELYTTCLSI